MCNIKSVKKTCVCVPQSSVVSGCLKDDLVGCIACRSAGDCRGSLIQALLQVEGDTRNAKQHPSGSRTTTTATPRTTTTPGEHKARYDEKASPKAFVCPECGKQFNAHYNLTRHMPVHTGARPFVCKVRCLYHHHQRIWSVVYC